MRVYRNAACRYPEVCRAKSEVIFWGRLLTLCLEREAPEPEADGADQGCPPPRNGVRLRTPSNCF